MLTIALRAAPTQYGSQDHHLPPQSAASGITTSGGLMRFRSTETQQSGSGIPRIILHVTAGEARYAIIKVSPLAGARPTKRSEHRR
jgi:hypothetical protein